MIQNEQCFTYGFLNIDKINPSPLRLCDFGVENRQNEVYDFANNDRGSLDGYLFQFTLDGYGYFEQSGKRVRLDRGKGFFIHIPDESRYYLSPIENNAWKFFYIHFTGSSADAFFEKIHFLAGSVLSLNEDSTAIRTFFDEYNGIRNGKKYKPYESGIFLFQFLGALLREIENPSAKSKNPFVEEALQFIQRHYTTDICLSETSLALGVSPEHLSRIFHEQEGITFMKYLTNVRLQHAIDLLLNTFMTINQIGTQCGYSNGNYFAKVFQKEVGMSPSAYRKENRGC